MNSLNNLESGASKVQPSYEVTDSDSHQDDASLTTAINAINAVGAAHPDDSSQEELPELELIPETHQFVRLPSLLQSITYQHHLDLDRAYSIYERIPQDQIPQEIRGLDKTLENLVTIEKFFIARDKLVVWREVANQSGVHEGSPEFAELNSLDDYLAKAAEFGDWLDQHPQALGITELRIEGAYLSSIPFEISKLTQLQTLNFGHNQIQRIEGLEPLTQLQVLRLNNNQIQKIEGLETLTQLQKLYLNSNQIQKVEGLENLTQLQVLWLNNNQIQKVERLETLTQLESLYLCSNQIQRIEGLELLTQLQFLSLRWNQIQKLEGLENLIQLQELNLENNQIQRIEGLESLTQLCRLYLDNNQIQKIEGLESLTQLGWLDLAQNQIQRIEGLETLMQLQGLYLGYNQIQKVEGVEHLPDLNLILSGNPISS